MCVCVFALAWPKFLASYTPANRRLGCGAGSARYARETHHVYRGHPDLPGVCASAPTPESYRGGQMHAWILRPFPATLCGLSPRFALSVCSLAPVCSRDCGSFSGAFPRVCSLAFPHALPARSLRPRTGSDLGGAPCLGRSAAAASRIPATRATLALWLRPPLTR